jgi:hypothetical protein
VQLDPKVIQVAQDHKDQLVLREIQEVQDLRVPQVQQVKTVLLTLGKGLGLLQLPMQ